MDIHNNMGKQASTQDDQSSSPAHQVMLDAIPATSGTHLESSIAISASLTSIFKQTMPSTTSSISTHNNLIIYLSPLTSTTTIETTTNSVVSFTATLTDQGSILETTTDNTSLAIAQMEASHSASAGRLQTFTCFPELTIELRKMIWTEVCFQERVIDLWGVDLDNLDIERSYFEEIYDLDENTEHVFMSYCRAPAVLHANQESRVIGLRHYSLEFGTSWEREIKDIRGITTTVKTCSPPIIYVNWACDILVPVNYSYNRLAPKDVFGSEATYSNHLRRIGVQAYYSPGYYASEFLSPLKLRTNLSEITIYVTDLEFRNYFEQAPSTLTFIKLDVSVTEDDKKDLDEEDENIEQLFKKAGERGEIGEPFPVIRLMKLIATPRDT